MADDTLDKDELEREVEFCNNLTEQKDKRKKEIAAYQKKIAEYAKGIREMYLDKVNGIITEQEYVDFSREFSVEKNRLEKLVVETEMELSRIEQKMQEGDNRRQLIEQYTNLETLDRETVEKLIDYISVGKRIPGTYNVPIEIHWNF